MNGIGGIIILVIVVGGWIIKAVAAMNENKAKKGPPGGQPRVDFDALADRRRQELQQQAQHRRAQQMPKSRSHLKQPDPSSMSMAERIEMARRRASGQQGTPVVDEQAQALRQQQIQAEQQRRQALARQQQQDKLRQQQKLQQQRRRQQPPPQAQRPARPPAQQSLSRIKQRETRKHQESHDRVHKTPQRGHAVAQQESALAPRGSKASSPLLNFGRLNRRSLRQAVALKEILDVPVALRKDHLK